MPVAVITCSILWRASRFRRVGVADADFRRLWRFWRLWRFLIEYPCYKNILHGEGYGGENRIARSFQ